VQVRVRNCKSANESKRYTLENCALAATFLRERPPGGCKDTGKRSDVGNERIVHDTLDDVCTVAGALTLLDGGDVGHSRRLVDGPCQIQDGDVDNQSDKSIDNDVYKSRSVVQKNVDGILNAGDEEEKDNGANDNDGSEEDAACNTLRYRNPFFIHSDSSSSSEEDSD